MRGLLPLLLFVPAVAAACATTDPITGTGGSTGTGRHSSSSGTLTENPDAGPRSCGVAADDPTCNTCLTARCCAEATTCAADATCLGCLGQAELSEQCSLDHAFSDLRTCLTDRCGGPCGLGGSSSSGSTTSSTSTSSSTSTTSTSSGSTSSSTSSTSTSSTSSTSSSTSSTSTSSTSSTSSSGSGPLTCAGVDGAVGCCDAAGTLHFCDTALQVVDQTCSGTDVCGWSPASGWYDCVPPPGGEDPAGNYPLSCGP